MPQDDHPFIKQARSALGIPEDVNFLDAVVPKFMAADQAGRKQDLARLDAAQTGSGDLRHEAQLGRVRRELRALDERLRKVGM